MFEKQQEVSSIEVAGINTRIPFTFKIQGSNDGNKYDDLSDVLTCDKTINNNESNIYNINNKESYKYYRLYLLNGTGGFYSIAKIQFYGTPDYESRTYIYDNGVEVMEVTAYANGHTAEKQADQLYLYKNNASTVTPQFYTTNKIDLTSKSVVYTVMGNVIVPDNEGWAGAGMICSAVPMTSSNYNNINIAKTPFTKYKTVTDVSNINQEAYVQHSLITSATNSMKATITEWWLE